MYAVFKRRKADIRNPFLPKKIGRPPLIKKVAARKLIGYEKSGDPIYKLSPKIVPSPEFKVRNWNDLKSAFTAMNQPYERYKVMRKMIVRRIAKGILPRGTLKAVGMHSFPGKNLNNERGIFTQSVKGQRGKHYVEKAITRTLSEYQTE